MLNRNISVNIKTQAVVLRKRGYSYGLINKKLGVAKSTLNNWLKKVRYVPNAFVLKRIREAPKKSRDVLREIRNKNIQNVKSIAVKELGRLSDRDLFMIGIGLYIGEGSKHKSGTVRIVNSDPEVIKIATNWFIKSCGLTTDNFTMALHLYPDNNIYSCIKYWSHITKIPVNQFRKTQVDIRKDKAKINRNRLPYGTAHLTIRACGNKRNGVYLFRRIMGWIEEMERQLNAGMVQW